MTSAGTEDLRSDVELLAPLCLFLVYNYNCRQISVKQRTLQYTPLLTSQQDETLSCRCALIISIY